MSYEKLFPVPKTATATSVHRRSNKPIMEKKRRARINNCLNELKNLLLEAMRKDPARHSKLEKADILEMTVRHLQTLQRQQMALALVADPGVVTKYKAGFNECAEEVSRYIHRVDGIRPDARQRLLNHLAGCMNGLNVMLTTSGRHRNMPASSTISALAAAVSSSTTTTETTPVQLIPSRLPSGDIAFLLPRQAISKWPNLATSDLHTYHHHHQPVGTGALSSKPSSQNMVVSSTADTSSSTVTTNNCPLPSPVTSDDDHRVTSAAQSPSPVLLSDDCSSEVTTGSSRHQLLCHGGHDSCEPHSGGGVPAQHMAGPKKAPELPVDLSKDADRMWRPW